MMDDWYARLTALEDGDVGPTDAAFDRSGVVRARAASMPGLPQAVVARLADDPDVNVRCTVARRADLTEAILDDLAWDESSAVRRVVAARADLPARAVERLRCDVDADVLDAIGEPFRAAAIRALDVPVDPRAGERKWPF